MKIAIFTTHPIQYQDPWFRSLGNNADVELKVFFSYIPDATAQSTGFGGAFHWDIPLREGYDSEVLGQIRGTNIANSFWSMFSTGFASALRSFMPDIVIIHGWNHVSMVQALLVSKAMRFPVLMRGESNDKKARSRWVTAVHRVYLCFIDGALAIGQSNRDFYLRLGLDPKRIRTAGYFVDNDRFLDSSNSMKERRAEIREKWEIPTDAFCAAFVGKLEPKKRVLDFLEALRISRIAGVNVYGLVVGNGEQLAIARAYAEEHKIGVSFVGFINQSMITEAYVSADALVLPSDFGETWGLVCNEAMACGVPAIVSERVGSAGDLVQNGNTGAVTRFAEPDAIAKVIVDWASHPLLHKEISENARMHVLANYTIEQAAEELLALASDVIGQVETP